MSAPSPRPYANPYLAGVGLGLVLLAAFVAMGRGIGASGAVSSCVVACVNAVAPAHAQAVRAYEPYLEGSLLRDWLFVEVVGVAVGGYVSARLAHRVKRGVDRGPRISDGARFALATVGGVLVGVGAKLARGCPSGQALTGGATLNVGSWAFMLAMFVGGYGLAWLVRRQWT
ncbi:MAG: YeeE/YedE thiosulfate transporter family protein [Polyangiaceae bacterium]